MLSGGEILIILVVALLVFGPDKLPELARTIGKFMIQIRRGVNEVTAEMRKEMDEMEKQHTGDSSSKENKTSGDKVDQDIHDNKENGHQDD